MGYTQAGVWKTCIRMVFQKHFFGVLLLVALQGVLYAFSWCSGCFKMKQDLYCIKQDQSIFRLSSILFLLLKSGVSSPIVRIIESSSE
jgi:hypothetical protein